MSVNPREISEQITLEAEKKGFRPEMIESWLEKASRGCEYSEKVCRFLRSDLARLGIFIKKRSYRSTRTIRTIWEVA